MTSPFVCAHGGARIQGYAHLDQETCQTWNALCSLVP